MSGVSYLIQKHLIAKKNNEDASIIDTINKNGSTGAQWIDSKPKHKTKHKVDETNHITGILIDDSQSYIEDPERRGTQY